MTKKQRLLVVIFSL